MTKARPETHSQEMAGETKRVAAAMKQCQDIQHMIEITSKHLDRLRSSFSNAGDELTKQEIRTLEGKLIKQFSEQLAVKFGLGPRAVDLVYLPSLEQWLKVVGVSPDTYDAILSRVKSLEELKDKTECELNRILLTTSGVSPGQRQEDLRRLARSLLNLRKYTDALVYGSKMYGPGPDTSKLELHWDSWDQQSLARQESNSPGHDSSGPLRTKTDLSSAPPVSPSSTLSPPAMSDGPPRTSLITPPATPPWLLLKDKATPPSNKKYWAVPHQLSLSKSKSHEAELSSRIENLEGREGEAEEVVTSSGYSSSTSEVSQTGRMRLPSSDPDSGHETPGHSVPSPVASPKSVSGSANSNLRVPVSPRTPGTGSSSYNLSHRPMTHMIAHRFTKTFKPGTCDFCQEYFFQGLKCKECKFRCHVKCEPNVPPSCGLPDQILDFFFEHITKEGSPSLPRLPPPVQPAPFDSSSSSCNSSSPSSPQVIVTSHPDTTPPWTVRHTSTGHPGHHFRFPEPSRANPASRAGTASGGKVPAIDRDRGYSPNPAVDTVRSNDSDRTLSGSSDSIGTVRTYGPQDSQDSTTSVEDGGSTWSSIKGMSIREWDIPFEELKISDRIGSGRFSTVHAGNWHGDVAIKFLDMENMDDESTLEAFRLDVATFR